MRSLTGRYRAGEALTLEGVRREGNAVYVCLDVRLGEEDLVREDGRGRTGTDSVNRTENETTVAGRGVDNAPHDAGPPLAVIYDRLLSSEARRRCCCDKVLNPIILAGEGGAAKIGQHKGGTEKERENDTLSCFQIHRGPAQQHSLTFVNGNAVHPWTAFLCSMYRCG